MNTSDVGRSRVDFVDSQNIRTFDAISHAPDPTSEKARGPQHLLVGQSWVFDELQASQCLPRYVLLCE